MSIGKMTAALAIASAVLLPVRAQADSTGTAGVVIGIEVNAPNSDEYANYQGRFFVKESADSVQVYRWQGTACSGYNLSDRQIAMLTSAMTTKKAAIIPYWKPGAGGARCVVSFSMTPSIKNVPQITR